MIYAIYIAAAAVVGVLIGLVLSLIHILTLPTTPYV